MWGHFQILSGDCAGLSRERNSHPGWRCYEPPGTGQGAPAIISLVLRRTSGHSRPTTARRLGDSNIGGSHWWLRRFGQRRASVPVLPYRARAAIGRGPLRQQAAAGPPLRPQVDIGDGRPTALGYRDPVPDAGRNPRVGVDPPAGGPDQEHPAAARLRRPPESTRSCRARRRPATLPRWPAPNTRWAWLPTMMSAPAPTSHWARLCCSGEAQWVVFDAPVQEHDERVHLRPGCRSRRPASRSRVDRKRQPGLGCPSRSSPISGPARASRPTRR